MDAKVYGDNAPQARQKLAKKTVTVTKGWSEAYGLFLKGESDLVLSYTTSPAYHILEEKKDNYAATNFSEGHYLQVEVAARTAASSSQSWRKIPPVYGFSGFQNAIPTGNWMYPVANVTLPAGFETDQTSHHARVHTSPKWRHNVRHGLANGTRRQPLIPGWLIPKCKRRHAGGSGCTGGVSRPVVERAAGDWVAVWQDSYLWHVVRFSFWQAFLGAALCRTRNIPRPRPLSQALFPGRQMLLRLCAMTLILPVLVAVFGILSVMVAVAGWPRSGNHLVWSGPFRPTACKRILLAHVF